MGFRVDSARTPCFEHKVENEISKQSRPKTNTEKTQRKKNKADSLHFAHREIRLRNRGTPVLAQKENETLITGKQKNRNTRAPVLLCTVKIKKKMENTQKQKKDTMGPKKSAEA